MDVTTAPTQLKKSSSGLRKIKKPTILLNIVDTPVLIKYDDDKADGRLSLYKMSGWLNFVETKLYFTANFMAYFYAHLHTSDPQNTSLLCSEINGRRIEITHTLIRKLFKLPMNLKKAYGHQQLSKKMGFDIMDASKYLCGGTTPLDPKKPMLNEIIVEARHEYEEVLRERFDVIREKNFKKMVYIQSKPEESVEDGEEMSTDDDDCDDSGEIDSEEGSKAE
ncbi:hypothetical protein Syun_001990 [Stephania yunnanensis]|uniref:Uncharacterized protein n=1 Tax=Stephania yunnanensis TaxID=152371 RepID=A0AAP0LFR6_9MAGN